MARLANPMATLDRVEESAAFSRGTVRGLGRIVWAVNHAGEWVKQIMHRPEVRRTVGDRKAESCQFIDSLTEKYRRKN
mgnify:CR=1 FL=1